MIQMHDIVKIELTPARKQALLAGGDTAQRLAQHDGWTMRVGGIQHIQEPEELRTFVLEDLMYTDPPYVYAPRADFVFVRHGEPPNRATVQPVDPEPVAPRDQMELFAGA